ncbi:DUF445 domain-containing protein [Acinetobacter sp.]|uniref:DUF445 domain-containing protein n=1 Tax=Acinetobacter sp. TaxID=472 RepID=UPI003CFBF7E6
MVLLKMVLIILVSAFIGFITNLIAIRMLFRPMRTHYLFGFRIPFTPGLIPKEKHKLGQRVGESMTQLLNPKILKEHLSKPEILNKIYGEYDSIIDQNVLIRYLPDTLRFWIFEHLAFLLFDKLPWLLESADLGGAISQAIVNYSNEELEALVLAVARRELKSITWLGAGLGAFIGLLQIFIMEMY